MQFRVATLNVWALPAPIGHQVMARIEAIGAQLPRLGLDVIGFQEVWTGAARRALVRAGARAGLVHAWHREQTLAGSGLLVLSRFAIRSARFEAYLLGGLPQHLTQPDYYGGKGLVELELETPGGPVVFVDTHLQARYGNQVDHKYRGHRAGQLVQLAAATRQISRPVIVVGDFNLKDCHEEYVIWMGLSGMADVAAMLGAEAPTIFPGNPYRTRSRVRRIDYIFSRGGRARHWRPRSARRVFDETFRIGRELATFSDHAGVFAEFDLEAGAASVPHVRPEAVGRAASALAAGRGRALTRRSQNRLWTGSGLAAAFLAVTSLRTPALSRRRFLRGVAQMTALGAAVPSVACSLLSEVWAPEELGAFARVNEQLARLADAARRESPLASAEASASRDSLSIPSKSTR